MNASTTLMKCFCIGILLASIVPVAAQTGPMDFATAMNIAGRQRMLTQRITKSYIQIGLGVNIEKSRQDLNDAIVLFESQLERLRKFSSDSAIHDAIAQIDKRWQPFKTAVIKEFSREMLGKLNAGDEELLGLCEELVYLIQDTGNVEIGRLVNTAGRQRMLSQRLAKFYMLMSAAVSTPYTRAQMDRTINEFRGALQALRDSTANNAVINAKLEEAAEQWRWLESSLLLARNEYYPEIVADASEKILRIMNDITGLYSGLK